MIDAISLHYNAPQLFGVPHTHAHGNKIHKDFQKKIQSVNFYLCNFYLARCQSPSIDNNASTAIINIEHYFQEQLFSIFFRISLRRLMSVLPSEISFNVTLCHFLFIATWQRDS